MPLTNYTELQASIATYLKRSDQTSRIVDFIALAEARIARVLRLQRMLTSTSGLNTAAGVATVALPARWVEWQRLRIATPNTPLEPAAPGEFAQRYAASSSALPRQYTIEGNVLRLGPTPDAVYSLDGVFYQMPEALSVTATNWLLTDHPGLYLWGALAESAPFNDDGEHIQLWETKFNQDLDQARKEDDRARFGGGSLRMRAR